MYPIRPATVDDAPEIARLSEQLGYVTSPDQMRARLQRLVNSSSDIVLVAEIAKNQLAGWIHAFESQHVQSDPRVEIGGLVVDERCRQKGVAKELMQKIEYWADERGYNQVCVRSQVFRTEAHTFYERRGYVRSKTQIAFSKKLRPS